MLEALDTIPQELSYIIAQHKGRLTGERDYPELKDILWRLAAQAASLKRATPLTWLLSTPNDIVELVETETPTRTVFIKALRKALNPVDPTRLPHGEQRRGQKNKDFLYVSGGFWYILRVLPAAVNLEYSVSISYSIQLVAYVAPWEPVPEDHSSRVLAIASVLLAIAPLLLAIASLLLVIA